MNLIARHGQVHFRLAASHHSSLKPIPLRCRHSIVRQNETPVIASAASDSSQAPELHLEDNKAWKHVQGGQRCIFSAFLAKMDHCCTPKPCSFRPIREVGEHRPSKVIVEDPGCPGAGWTGVEAHPARWASRLLAYLPTAIQSGSTACQC